MPKFLEAEWNIAGYLDAASKKQFIRDISYLKHYTFL